MDKKSKTFDAKGKNFGRLASEVAVYLQGKHDPEYQPNKVLGYKAIVKNIDQMSFTGNKLDTNIIYRHTGYPGGIKKMTLRQSFEKNPQKLFINAVRRMLPKNKLNIKHLKNLIIN